VMGDAEVSVAAIAVYPVPASGLNRRAPDISVRHAQRFKYCALIARQGIGQIVR
jgi:hypothetical protein